ncbi:MAG: hypothetical protein Q8O88_03505 [bacterium]|nr:hypothetical protein [bacterium]
MEQKRIGTSDYFIFENGCLWSDRQKGKFLKGMINNGGYRQYFFDGNGNLLIGSSENIF